MELNANNENCLEFDDNDDDLTKDVIFLGAKRRKKASMEYHHEENKKASRINTLNNLVDEIFIIKIRIYNFGAFSTVM